MAYWKQIVGFPHYTITSDGKVWSDNCSRVRKSYVNNCGYKAIVLCKIGKPYSKLIHRLVLETFLGKCPSGMEACHKNGNKLDNRLENLRWDTRSNNHKDAVKHGVHVSIRCGEESTNHKLTKQDVMGIWKLWWSGIYTQQEIADTYNVTRSNIGHIINDKTWKHIWR